MAKTYKLGKGQSLNPAEVHICIQYKLFEKNENNKTEAGMPLEMQLTTVVLIQERANFGRSNNQTKSNVTKYWQNRNHQKIDNTLMWKLEGTVA